MYLNENKTLRELRENGFEIYNYCAYFEINPLVRIVFDLNCNNSDYLRLIGTEYSALVENDKYKKEIDNVIEKLKESDFILESKCLNGSKRYV